MQLLTVSIPYGSCIDDGTAIHLMYEPQVLNHLFIAAFQLGLSLRHILDSIIPQGMLQLGQFIGIQ